MELTKTIGMAILLTGSQCDDGREHRDGDDESRACAGMCAHLGCQGDIGPEQTDPCHRECIGPKRSEAEANSARCLDAYLRTVACVATIDCVEYLAFGSGTEDDVCALELRTLNSECPDFAFEFLE